MNDDELEFDENCLTGRPLLVSDIREMFAKIDKAYRMLDDGSDELKEVMYPVLGLACDCACNLSYELGFDDPADVENEKYNCWLIKARVKPEE